MQLASVRGERVRSGRAFVALGLTAGALLLSIGCSSGETPVGGTSTSTALPDLPPDGLASENLKDGTSKEPAKKLPPDIVPAPPPEEGDSPEPKTLPESEASPPGTSETPAPKTLPPEKTTPEVTTPEKTTPE